MRPNPGQRTKADENKSLIRVHPCPSVAIFCLCLAASLSAQTRLTLQQAGSRMAPDWTPVYDGKEVLVSGQVSAAPVWVSESLYLAIQDQAGYGLLLEGSERRERPFADRHVGEVPVRLVAQIVLAIQLQQVFLDLPIGIARPALQLAAVGDGDLGLLDERTLEG